MSSIKRDGLVVGILLLMMWAGAIAPYASASPSPSPIPAAVSTSGQPASTLAQGAGIFPNFNPTTAIYQAIGGLLYGMDSLFTDEMSQIWNPLVAGSDNLDGTENAGVLVDNTKLKQMWAISLGIAGGSLLVLLFTLMALLWMVGEFVGTGHELGRLLVNFLAFFVLMGASYFLITQLVNIDNALVGGVNTNVVVELRSLKAFQLINLQDPSAIDDINALIKALVDALLMVFVVIELLILFVVYFIRIVALWILVVVSPFVLALGILPAARGLVVYWFRMLCGFIFLKFVNVLVFMTFIFIGAASDVAVMNVLLVFTMLLFMIMIPAAVIRALGEPSGAISSARRTAHQLAVSRPVQIARNRLAARKAA
jgi:ABC-type multidrug transport system fused ATPase/permease subunit